MNQLFCLSFLFLFSVNFLSAQDYDAVLKKADLHRGGQLSSISWDLNVINYEKEKEVNNIQLSVEASSSDEGQFALISFLNPGKYKGQKLLLRNNTMWFFKKGLRKPITISSRERLSGSAANADVASTNYYYDYKILKAEKQNDFYVFELEAKTNTVSYAKIKYWVSEKTNLGEKSEFYGKSDKLIKTAKYKYSNKIDYQGKSIPFISEIVINDNLVENKQTVLKISNLKLGKINMSKFQVNNLN